MTVFFVALAVMAGICAFFAVVIALSDRFLSVEEDPRVDQVEEALPGNNCGACGLPGCRAFAEQLVAGDQTPADCTVSNEEQLILVADIVGVEVGDAERDIARLRCASGAGLARHLASYQGIESCRAAAIVNGGDRTCHWGCLGLADCEKACTFDAIVMNSVGLPSVTPEQCTACGDCVEICPLDLFVLIPESERLFVQCATPLEGDDARASCEVTCDACGRCAADAQGDAVVMEGGLPRIRYDLFEQPGPESTWRCPTGAIRWLEGKQFVEDEPPRSAYG